MLYKARDATLIRFVIWSNDNNNGMLLPRSCTHKLNRIKVMQVTTQELFWKTKIDPTNHLGVCTIGYRQEKRGKEFRDNCVHKTYEKQLTLGFFIY